MLNPLPKSDRPFKAWLRALAPGKKLGAMDYKTCALGLFAKTIGADPVSHRGWSQNIESELFQATRELAPRTRTITAKQFRKWLGMREPKAA